MCYVVECETCKKKTWKGCGRHAEQVMADVSEEDRCNCRAGGASAGASKAGEKAK